MHADQAITLAESDVPTKGHVDLPPDPRALEALGRNHSLEAAVAELVDNSIDAGAQHCLIRFVRDGESLSRLFVVDDGAGMTDPEIDVAMTVGGTRTYRAEEIGRFGLGLKAASFSQARAVTVLSRSKAAAAVGRRWVLGAGKADFSCELVERDFATAVLDRDWGFPSSRTGTVVRWDEVKGFPIASDEGAIDRFLHTSISQIRTHTGLVFHRILARGALKLFIDIADPSEGILHREEVEPLDPFAYARTGEYGWPKTLTRPDSDELAVTCHIWPGRSSADAYRLDKPPIESQGLYIYFNDRLIQRGGWNGLTHADKQLNLARVRLDVAGDIERVLALKPEKNGIEPGPEFRKAIHALTAPDGTNFADYLQSARDTFKQANRRQRLRAAVVPPGAGIDPRVRKAIARELPLRDDPPLDIRWDRLDPEEFFYVDREENILWLNQRYRRSLLGGRPGSLNDVPVVKALLFLLTEHIFAGQNLGPRDKDNLDLWQAILIAAALSEGGDA